MAIVQTGSALQLSIGSNTATGTVSTTITVPADAELIVVGVGDFYAGGGGNFSTSGSMTFTKGGADTAMLKASGLGDASSGASQTAMFYMVLPDTGTNKTLKWAWGGGTSQATGIVGITFWKGINTGTPVRATSGGMSTTTPPYTSGSMTTQFGDLIVAWAAGYASAEGTINSWSNLTLLSQFTAQVTNGAGNYTDGAWATGSPSTGSTTVAASTGTNFADGGIVAITLIPAMAWSFVGVSNVVEVSTTAHALVTTGITGLTAGDLLVACISSRIASTTSVTLPSGWTLVSEQKNNNILTTSSALPSGVMAYCIRGASDPALTFTHPVAPAPAIGRIVAYRGVDATAPKDIQTSFTTAITTTAVSGTGMTTTQAEDLIVAMAAGGQESAWSAFNATNPVGASGSIVTTAPTTTWSERADSLTVTGNDTSLAIFDAIKITTGATGNLTATASVSSGQVVVAGAFRRATIANAWNIGKKTSSLTLSNNDKAGTLGSSVSASVFSTQLRLNETAGAYYAEFVVNNSTSTNVAVGIVLAAAGTGTLGSASVFQANGNVVINNTTVTTISTYATSDIVCVAWNAGTERIWFRVNNGLWNNDASANPATGVNGIDVSVITAANQALIFYSFSAGDSVTLRTELSELTQSPLPSGFTSWMGEALSSVTHYTMPVTVGTLTAAGQIVTLPRNRVMPVTAGTLTASGQAVVPKVTLPVTQGTLTPAGQAVTLRRARVPMVAGLGTLTASGQDATLTKSAAVVHRTMPADTGTLTLAGQTASLRSVRKLVAGQGTLTLAGQVATTRFGHRTIAGLGTLALAGQTAIVSYARRMPAGQGTLTPGGQNVTLRYSRKMPAGLGTITPAGQTVNTIYSGAGDKILPAGLGTITINGQTVTLRYARKMTAGTGTLALAGQVVTLRRSRLPLVAGLGTLTLAGQDVTLTRTTSIVHRTMPAALGTLTLAGQDATLTRTGAAAQYVLLAGLGTLTIDGQPVVVRYAHRMAAGVGVLTVSGQTVTLNTTAPATFSTLTLSGRDVTLRKINKIRMPADAGTLALSGQVLTLRRSRVPMAAGLGTLTLSGRPIALPKGRMLAAGVGSIVLSGKAAGLVWKEQIRMAAEPGILHLVEQDVMLSRTTVPPAMRHETLRFGRSVYVSRW